MMTMQKPSWQYFKTRGVSGSVLMKRPSWAPVVDQDSRVILVSAHGGLVPKVTLVSGIAH